MRNKMQAPQIYHAIVFIQLNFHIISYEERVFLCRWTRARDIESAKERVEKQSK